MTNPAQAIQAHLVALLHLAPHRAQAEVAHLLGEIPQAWGRYVRGESDPGAKRIAEWAAAAAVDLTVRDGQWFVTA